MNGFKLLSLELQNNQVMSSDNNLIFNFTDKVVGDKMLYTTVLIGPNGTRKSMLFRIIINLFKEIYDLATKNERSYSVDGFYTLKYKINKDIYLYSNITRHEKLISLAPKGRYKTYLYKNNNLINFSIESLPSNIICHSIMIFDKFPIFKDDSFSIYKYLGVKGKLQNASSKFYIRQIIDFVVSNYNNKSFRDSFVKIIDFLGLERNIIVFYTTQTSRLFRNDGSLSKHDLDEYFSNLNNKYIKNKKQPPFKLEYYNKIKSNKSLIDSICSIFDSLYIEDRIYNIPHSPAKQIEYDLFNKESLKLLTEDYQNLEHLRMLGLLSPPVMTLTKKSSYSLEESSSGELHFLTSMVSLLSTIQENSLIFVDEPEVSLHPNWQMRYFECIRELFGSESYSKSHLFVATHSHFLISDLKGENSKILGLSQKNKLEVHEFATDINTFGWSAEEVLYRIFNVRSSRNGFMEYDITKLITLINRNSEDYTEIGRILNKIRELELSDSDPLKIISEKAQKYLNSKNA